MTGGGSAGRFVRGGKIQREMRETKIKIRFHQGGRRLYARKSFPMAIRVCKQKVGGGQTAQKRSFHPPRTTMSSRREIIAVVKEELRDRRKSEGVFKPKSLPTRRKELLAKA